MSNQNPHSNAELAKNRELLLHLLQQLADNPALADEDERLKALIAKINKQARKRQRKATSDQRKKADAQQKAQSQLFQLNDEKNPVETLLNTQHEALQLHKPQRCYICKVLYQELHFFYHQLCPSCAERNFANRNKSCDLQGRYALITGGRIKIGYEIALCLLRWGAHVIVTTRFPQNALAAYQQEADYEQWAERLDIYGLDLRNLPAVEAFIGYVQQSTPALDILINNAAQTIKRPLAFYAELLEKEKQNLLLAGEESLLPAQQSLFFPKDTYDIYGQQVDLRPMNSWKQQLEEVDLREMLEVQLVNVTSPFLLNSQLKAHMCKSAAKHRYIVNVSAVEGQFQRAYKSPHHPHTNMAKAALNMMTRTAAQAYAQAGIFMTSVDTGWVTDENPAPIREKLRDRGFVPPLDVIDGAMRVLAPIIDGETELVEPQYGVFLKDYDITPW